MTTEMLNAEDIDIDLKNLLDRIDEICPDTDLYSVLIDEQITV